MNTKKIDQILRGLDKIREQQHQELYQLLDGDEELSAAFQLLHDEVRGAVEVAVCHLQHIQWGNGKWAEPTELSTMICKNLDASYERLTGRRYQPPICRRMENPNDRI